MVERREKAAVGSLPSASAQATASPFARRKPLPSPPVLINLSHTERHRDRERRDSVRRSHTRAHSRAGFAGFSSGARNKQKCLSFPLFLFHHRGNCLHFSFAQFCRRKRKLGHPLLVLILRCLLALCLTVLLVYMRSRLDCSSERAEKEKTSPGCSERDPTSSSSPPPTGNMDPAVLVIGRGRLA